LLLTNDHLTVTRELADESPCVRRRYGCLITNGKETIVTNNLRVSKCCNQQCVRQTGDLPHGQNVDYGAEIHAEQAALIKWNFPVDRRTVLLIQGFSSNTDTVLCDEDLYPCHVCALMIKYAGFKSIFITNRINILYSVPIDEIIAYREEAYV
jgi:deoxycytidylate deaminase